MSRVVCAGHVNWDITLHVDALPDPDGEAAITHQSAGGGGSASNTASALAGLDVDVSLLGSIGTDRYGTLVADELEAAGVDCSVLRTVDGQTTVKYIVVDDDGEVFVFANEGINEAYEASDLPVETLSGADRLHLTSQSPETATELCRRAADHSIPVSFDPGRRLGTRPYDDLVRQVDLLFVNEREASEIADTLTDRARPTVIKRGDGGALFRDGAETVSHDGFAVTPRDTAGAGDAFAAGFLATRLRDRPVTEALATANACGALAVESAGARAELSWTEVDCYRSRH